MGKQEAEKKEPGKRKAGKKNGRRPMESFRAVLLWGIVLAAVLLAGCSRKTEEDQGYQVVVDDLADIMLAQDADSASYDRALQAVRDYLEAPDQAGFEAAMTVIDDTIGQMKADLDGIVSYQVEDELAEALKRYQIDPEEYVVNANMRAVRLADAISGLEALKNELDLADLLGSDLAMGNLEFWTSYYTRYQEYLKNYSYYTINYWFAQWDGNAAAYAKEQLTDRLVSFRTEASVWEDSKDAVERKMDLCLDGIETLGHELETYIGTVQEEIYELENQLK